MGSMPTDAELSDHARHRAEDWDRLLARLVGRAPAYLDVAQEGRAVHEPHGVRPIARKLGIDNLTYREGGGSRELEARMWCTGLVTGGSCKGLLFRSGEAFAPLVPVASCDGRAPWKGCPEHATCVVAVAGRPGWFVSCDYDL